MNHSTRPSAYSANWERRVWLAKSPIEQLGEVVAASRELAARKSLQHTEDMKQLVRIIQRNQPSP
jgi:hypothetical protein